MCGVDIIVLIAGVVEFYRKDGRAAFSDTDEQVNRYFRSPAI